MILSNEVDLALVTKKNVDDTAESEVEQGDLLTTLWRISKLKPSWAHLEDAKQLENFFN